MNNKCNATIAVSEIKKKKKKMDTNLLLKYEIQITINNWAVLKSKLICIICPNDANTAWYH